MAMLITVSGPAYKRKQRVSRSHSPLRGQPRPSASPPGLLLPLPALVHSPIRKAPFTMTTPVLSPKEPAPEFQAFVPDHERLPELTVRALLLGCFFGLVFGAVTVYVGLRAGL